MTKPIPAAIIKVVLDDVKPEVMRRLEVPMTVNLDRLHMVLQAAMGWTNSHLYEFRFKNDGGYGIPDPDGAFHEPQDARKTTLLEVIEDTGVKPFKYLYDFGDGWEHSIEIERIDPSAPGSDYPRLLDAVGCCPPEDIGGPWGYQDAREAIADPKHENHLEIIEYWGADIFKNDTLDILAIKERVSNLARRTTKKPRSKSK